MLLRTLTLLTLFTPTVLAGQLELQYGANLTDINGDGVADLIVKTRWENMNGHSFDRYRIAVAIHDAIVGQTYQDVPLGKHYKDEINTSEGADCATSDDRAFHTGYVFKLNDKRMLEITEYSRIWESPETRYPVTKTIYVLADSDTKLVGDAPVFLKKVSSVKLLQKACDVRELNPEIR